MFSNYYLYWSVMNDVHNIQARVDTMPPELQRPILDYIDFLEYKYQRKNREHGESQMEITDDMKAFLEERIQWMKDHPEDGLTPSEAQKTINEKMGWK